MTVMIGSAILEMPLVTVMHVITIMRLLMIFATSMILSMLLLLSLIIPSFVRNTSKTTLCVAWWCSAGSADCSPSGV